MSGPSPCREPPHPGWPRIASALFYDDAAAAIDWLVEAFGFTVRLKIVGAGGRIDHSELELGGGLVMVASATRPDRPDRAFGRSPRTLDGANTQSLCVVVDDPDAHCARARAAGATILDEPTTQDHGADYGALRSYCAVDPEGHHWWFLRQVRGPVGPVGPPEQA